MSALYHQPIPNASGIYRIVCTVTGKFYIGSAVSLHRRWIDHRKHLRNNTHDNQKLQRAWNKYTESAFVFEIVELVLVPEMLTAREQHWIDKLKPFFNIAKVAGSCLGIKRSPETRAKLSALARGRPGPVFSPETRAKLSAAKRGNAFMLGKKFTPSHRAKLSAASMGNKSNQGRKNSPEHRARLLAANLGKKHSPERIEKNRQTHLGRQRSVETRQKMSNSKMKTLIVTSPDGETFTIHGIGKFCREHHLDHFTLLCVARGERGPYKGWIAHFPDT